MKRISISEKNGNLNAKILVKLSEFDAHEQAFDPNFNMTDTNRYCTYVVELIDIVPEEIEISKKALELLKKSNEDVFTEKEHSSLFVLENKITIAMDRKYYKSLDKLSNLSELNICIRKNKFGYKRNALFNKILTTIKFKELIRDF